MNFIFLRIFVSILVAIVTTIVLMLTTKIHYWLYTSDSIRQEIEIAGINLFILWRSVKGVEYIWNEKLDEKGNIIDQKN